MIRFLALRLALLVPTLLGVLASKVSSPGMRRMLDEEQQELAARLEELRQDLAERETDLALARRPKLAAPPPRPPACPIRPSRGAYAIIAQHLQQRDPQKDDPRQSLRHE